MGSFMSVCQSFFKLQGVSYYTEGRTITFPCFQCQSMAIMNTEDTSWRCASDHNGNLKTLIRLSEQGVQRADAEVYNPRQGKAKIDKMIDKLRSKYQDAGLKKELGELRNDIKRLVEHLHGGEEA
jgi:hypothetical protein